MTEQKFQKILAGIAAQRAGASDAVASETVDLYPSMRFKGDLITSGTRILWDGKLKRAAVDLWDTPENAPDVAPNLWEDITYYKGYRIIPETITAGLAFKQGEIGYWPADGKFYRAKNNGTTWTPAAYPAAWEEENI